MVNSMEIRKQLERHGDGSHEHEPVLGKVKLQDAWVARSRLAQEYPRKFCMAICRGLMREIEARNQAKGVSSVLAVEELENQSDERKIASILRRCHNNLGHPSTPKFIAMLKAARASETCLKIAKGLTCTTCEPWNRPNLIVLRRLKMLLNSIKLFVWTPLKWSCPKEPGSFWTSLIVLLGIKLWFLFGKGQMPKTSDSATDGTGNDGLVRRFEFGRVFSLIFWVVMEPFMRWPGHILHGKTVCVNVWGVFGKTPLEKPFLKLFQMKELRLRSFVIMWMLRTIVWHERTVSHHLSMFLAWMCVCQVWSWQAKAMRSLSLLSCKVKKGSQADEHKERRACGFHERRLWS